MTDRAAHEGTTVVTGSMRPFVTAGATALALGGFGGAALRAGGLATFPLVVLAIGLLALVVLLVDLPLRTEVGEEGIVRVCLLRRGRIQWSDVAAVERQRRRLAGAGTGGLVVRGRRGRWLLTTSAEPPDVHARLVATVATHAPSVRMLAEPPVVSTDDR